MVKKTIIKRNKIRCLKCLDEIESTHRHDFKWCKCRSVAIDGGHDYFRRYGNSEDYENLNKTEEVEVEELPDLKQDLDPKIMKDADDYFELMERDSKVPLFSVDFSDLKRVMKEIDELSKENSLKKETTIIQNALIECPIFQTFLDRNYYVKADGTKRKFIRRMDKVILAEWNMPEGVGKVLVEETGKTILERKSLTSKEKRRHTAFLKKHKGHKVYLSGVQTGIAMAVSVCCQDCKKEEDISDYENW